VLSRGTRGRARLQVTALLAGALVAGLAARSGASGAAGPHARWTACRNCVRTWPISYRTHDGKTRVAYVLLPRWYGPRNHPRIPLVISPHGRGITARINARMWKNYPALGSFAVVSPQGQGRVLRLFSWGYPGQIADLARMPRIVRHALPWLRVDRSKIYAVGTSMGGQETLLLLARHPHLLAGAAAFDSVTNLRERYYAFSRLGCNAACLHRWRRRIGGSLQELARTEVGGPPGQYPRRYVMRSPQHFARRIARSGVPLELWWSRSDRVVANQDFQSRRLLATILRINPHAPVDGFEGTWWHSTEMHTLLVPALIDLGLLSDRYLGTLTGVQRITATRDARRVRRVVAWYR
jgi:pimeloyl-ACP methyl ester carboxylesterase